MLITSKIRLPLIGLLLLFIGHLSSQPMDSLRMVLVQENPELKALSLDYQAAQQQAAQQTQLPDLEIGLGVFVLPIETRTGPQQFRVGATQPLPWPGKLAAMAELADLKARPVLENMAARELALLYEFEVAYYKLASLTARKAVLQERLPLYASLDRLALSRVENARGSSVDVYRLQIQQQAIARKLESLENERRQQIVTINRLLNRPGYTPVVTNLILEDRAAAALLEVGSLENYEPVASHPSVRIFQLQQEAARQAIRVSELDAKPDFGVGIDYIATGKRDDMDPPGNGRDVILPRAMLRIPLSGNKYRAKQQEEELKIRSLDARRELVVNQLKAEIDRGRLAMENAAAELVFLNEQSRLVDVALTVAQTEYANNRRSMDELLRLQNELIDYQLEAVLATTEILFQRALVNRWLPNMKSTF